MLGNPLRTIYLKTRYMVIIPVIDGYLGTAACFDTSAPLPGQSEEGCFDVWPALRLPKLRASILLLSIAQDFNVFGV